MSVLGVLLGLAALAGALYALQRLRVRHQERQVVTTLFWKAAVEDTRARVLTKRFRHPWAYALLLLIGALIWVALADPEIEHEADARYVLLLDASAGMARGDRFAQATDALRDAVDALPRDATTVLRCGGRTRALLVPGESALLLDERLGADDAPEPVPASVDATIRRLAGTGERIVCRVFGDAPVGVPSSDALRIERAPLDGSVDETNRTIAAIGVSEPATDTGWDTVDVFVEVRGPALGGLMLDAPGAAEATVERREVDAHTLQVVYRGVPADGRELVVSLPDGDALALDDRAAITLPERRAIRVALSPTLASVFGPLLAADAAVKVTDDAPDVVVRAAGETLGGDVPAIEVVPASEQQAAFHVTDPAATADADTALRDAATALGLDDIDARSLAQTAGRTIEVRVDGGAVRRVALWEELLGEPYDFLPSRAFPMFVARAVRWLADVPELVPFVGVGEPLEVRGGLREPALETLGAPFTPDRPGALVLADGRRITASLQDPAIARPAPTDTAEAPREASGGRTSLTTVFLLAAFALLLGEWHLFRTGRIP